MMVRTKPSVQVEALASQGSFEWRGSVRLDVPGGVIEPRISDHIRSMPVGDPPDQITTSPKIGQCRECMLRLMCTKVMRLGSGSRDRAPRYRMASICMRCISALLSKHQWGSASNTGDGRRINGWIVDALRRAYDDLH